MCINMFRERHQRPRIKIVSNHVYFVIVNKVKEFIFMTFNLFVKNVKWSCNDVSNAKKEEGNVMCVASVEGCNVAT